MKAHLKYFTKNLIHDRYVVELSIFEVGKSPKYPDGVKYGLICKDLKSGDKLITDFELMVFKELVAGAKFAFEDFFISFAYAEASPTDG